MEPLLKSFIRVILAVLLLYGVMLGLLYSSEKSAGKKASKSVIDYEVDDKFPAAPVPPSRELPQIGDDAAAHDDASAHVEAPEGVRQAANPPAVTVASASAIPAPLYTDATISTAYSDVLLLKPQQENNHFSAAVSIWRDSAAEYDDRILGQMRYRPASAAQPNKIKIILVPTGLGGMREGRADLVDNKCPVTECELTADTRHHSDAHVVLWQNHFVAPPGPRPQGQIWALFFLESPYHTPSLGGARGLINWTSTYRHDSTIVAPYERFTSFNASVLTLTHTRNYAAGKTKKVAWFVSNCGARNNRLGYAQELGKHIAVDIYGGCGTHRCDRAHANDCFKLLSQEYKFYLSFENSNCRDYITEKFFLNGLMNDILPIVMGAHPEDYQRAAPFRSYIHVDEFDSPAALAKRLLELDADDAQYNAYFAWKGTGANINTFFWCRVCAMAHAAESHAPTWYDDIEEWWRGTDVCTSQLSAGELWPRWKR